MQPDKKKLKQSYQQERRPMGVFQIRNLKNERIFVGAGIDINGIINRNRFQLEHGNHMNEKLQSEWKELGAESFAFESLDQMLPPNDVGQDRRKDLAWLKPLMRATLQPYEADRGARPRLTPARTVV